MPAAEDTVSAYGEVEKEAVPGQLRVLLLIEPVIPGSFL